MPLTVRTPRPRRSVVRSRALPVALACCLVVGLAGAGSAGAQAPAPTSSGTTRAGEAYGPFDTAAELVRQSYVDLLHREPTANELAVATASLQGGQDAEDFLAALIDLPEMNTNVKQVIRLYRAYYLRNPDLGGFRHWISMRRSGWTLPQISNQFAAAPEFAVRYGSLDDGQFIDLIYRNVLDRTPDNGGRTYWLGKMAEGLYRGQLMTSFSESPEYIEKNVGAANVVALYNGMFQASIPRGLYDYYAPAVQSGGTSTAELARQFLDDPKYHARF